MSSLDGQPITAFVLFLSLGWGEWRVHLQRETKKIQTLPRYTIVHRQNSSKFHDVHMVLSYGQCSSQIIICNNYLHLSLKKWEKQIEKEQREGKPSSEKDYGDLLISGCTCSPLLPQLPHHPPLQIVDARGQDELCKRTRTFFKGFFEYVFA